MRSAEEYKYRESCAKAYETVCSRGILISEATPHEGEQALMYSLCSWRPYLQWRNVIAISVKQDQVLFTWVGKTHISEIAY